MEAQPRNWSVLGCAAQLLESDKSEEIDGLIWDLRGLVFFTLKEMGKFDDDAEGPDHQPYIDLVMKKLVELI